MPDIYSIRQLHERQGWPVRRIARELHYSRKTVRKYLNRTEEAPTDVRSRHTYQNGYLCTGRQEILRRRGVFSWLTTVVTPLKDACLL